MKQASAVSILTLILAATPGAATTQTQQERGRMQVENRAKKLSAAGETDQAAALLAPLLNAHPEDPGLLEAMAQVRMDQKQWQKAEELLTRALIVRPGLTNVQLELGQAQMQEGMTSEAMKSFAAVLAIQPNNQTAKSGEARAAIAEALWLRNAGAMDGALATLAHAKALVPDNPELLMDFGLQADSMHIYQDADAALRQAHRLAPDDAKILYGLAHVELDEQKMPQAEADLREYLRLRPNDASAHYGLGHLLHMMVKDNEAKLELERSIALDPGQTESWYELGEIALNAHDDSTARADYTRVLQRDPKHGGALTGMGILAYRAKDYTAADDYLSRAVTVAPDYAAAHRFYAMALTRLGKKQLAEKEEDLAQSLTRQQNTLQHGYVILNAPHQP